MNIPEKIKIGYKDFKVNKIAGEVINDNQVCYGFINHNNGIINISTLYSDDQQKCTFIHECMHGIDEIVEANLTEDQIRRMSKGLYDFIKSNPQMFMECIDEIISPSKDHIKKIEEIFNSKAEYMVKSAMRKAIKEEI